jgi:cation:H+ antiporter
MVIVGFGTSTPEMTVSALASLRGHPEIALGNAYGSNIANIGIILGLTALVRPIVVHSRVLRMELPILALATVMAAWQIGDGEITRREALMLLAVFPVLMGWIIRQGLRVKADALGREMSRELNIHAMPLRRSVVWIASGLALLAASSYLLVWGAVALARWMGVGELFIGLTVVAVGASLRVGLVDHGRPPGRTRYRSRKHPGLQPVQHPVRGRNCRRDRAHGRRNEVVFRDVR